MKANRYLLFALVGVSMLVSAMQGSMVNVAINEIRTGLDSPLRWVGWVISIYTVAQAVSAPVSGKLSDELGRRTVFVGGLVLFVIGSFACAAAPNIYLLIVARVVQGLAGGSLMPSAYGIVAEAFPDNRAQALGMISSTFPIGGIIGPNIGGLLVEHLSWRWTFLFNVPLGLLVIAAALMLMRDTGEERQRRPIDFQGAGLLALAVTSLVFALTELSQRAESAQLPIVAGALTVAVAAGLLFMRRETRAPAPILDLRLLRRREFAFVNTLNFFYGFAVFGLFSFIPLYARTGYGMSPSQTGLLLTPRAVAMIGASALASVALPRTGYRKPVLFGMLGLAGLMLLLSLGIHEPTIGDVTLSNFTYLAIVIGLLGFTFGVTGPASNNAAIELAPDQIAAISGLRGMFRQIGGAVGSATVVLLASRAATEAGGLEESFLLLAVVAAASSLLVVGIPDRAARRLPVAAPQPAGGDE